jgi:hypothetical protein
MPKKLTVAEQAIVAKASQDLHQYERICQEHSAVLHRDAEGYIKANQEYTKLKPSGVHTTPRRIRPLHRRVGKGAQEGLQNFA